MAGAASAVCSFALAGDQLVQCVECSGRQRRGWRGGAGSRCPVGNQIAVELRGLLQGACQFGAAQRVRQRVLNPLDQGGILGGAAELIWSRSAQISSRCPGRATTIRSTSESGVTSPRAADPCTNAPSTRSSWRTHSLARSTISLTRSTSVTVIDPAAPEPVPIPDTGTAGRGSPRAFRAWPLAWPWRRRRAQRAPARRGGRPPALISRRSLGRRPSRSRGGSATQAALAPAGS
jgi:hypothetical protein